MVVQVPWLIDESGEADLVLKKFIDLKLSLMPYLYSTAIKTHKTGVAMMRPLFVEFPEDPFVWNVDTQYMLGPNLMVVPVFSAEGTMQYYVPKGSWYGLIDGKIRTGPGFITETHDFFSLPLLLRPGRAIVLSEARDAEVGARRQAAYDYATGITVLVNSVGESIDLVVEIPDYSTPGEISTVLKIVGDENHGSVVIVSGSLKGQWKVKNIKADGGSSDLVANDEVKLLEW